MRAVDIRDGRLARNTLLNLIGQAFPILVAIISIPFVVRGLGTDRFALLSLTWVVLGYSAIFDFGLARATTKYVAEALGKGELGQVPRILWTTVTIQAVLGLLGAALFVGITPLLVENLFNIPVELVREAKIVFYLVAATIPIIMIFRAFVGLLEGAQRFDLVNVVNLPSSSAVFLAPLLGVTFGWTLPVIILILVACRLLALLAQVWLSVRAVDGLNLIPHPDMALARSLLGFGGWITATNVLIPTFVYLDRFLIGLMFPLKAIAYYNPPREMLQRLTIIPASLSRVMFPAFSTLASGGSQDELSDVVARSIKYMTVAMVLPILVLFLFAEPILELWLGSEFAVESTDVVRILSVVVLLAAIGNIPLALVEGIGRPDIPAKLHLIELPVFASLAFFLITHMGITGAALAWLLRSAWHIPILFVISMRIAKVPSESLLKSGTFNALVAAAVLLIVAALLVTLLSTLSIQIMGFIALAMVACSVAYFWYGTFDDRERGSIKTFIKMADFRSIRGRNPGAVLPP